MAEVKWDIRREGRQWGKEEFLARWELLPEKFEIYDGKLFWSQEERVRLLAMLLENEGIDKALQLGDPELWREAISQLE